MTQTIAPSGLTGAAIATVVGLGTLFAPAAQADPLQLFDSSSPDLGGTVETLVPSSPGVYGFEARGGYASNPNRTWEVGVGTHTSQPGNFAQGDINWLDDTGAAMLYDFSLNWKPGSNVTATVGDTVVAYDADWEVGNAIKFLVKRNSYFWLDTVDGVAFDYEVDQLTNNKNDWTNFVVAGESLLDGWSLTGKIGLTPHEKGSFNEVTIKPGLFTPDEEPAVVPEPATILGLLGVLGVATQLRKR